VEIENQATCQTCMPEYKTIENNGKTLC